MRQLELKKLTEIEYYVGGFIEVGHWKSKSVVVDGEIYTNKWREEKRHDLDKMVKKQINKLRELRNDMYWGTDDFCVHVFNKLALFGIPEIKVYYPHFFTSYSSFFGHSENEIVDLFMELVKQINLDGVSFYSGKEYRSHVTNNEIAKSNLYSDVAYIETVIMGYGFNNRITANIDFRYLFNYDIKNILHKNKGWDYLKFVFPKDLDKITENDKIKTAYHLLLNKIEYKQKQH
jgi:hypothetical protein